MTRVAVLTAFIAGGFQEIVKQNKKGDPLHCSWELTNKILPYFDFYYLILTFWNLTA